VVTKIFEHFGGTWKKASVFNRLGVEVQPLDEPVPPGTPSVLDSGINQTWITFPAFCSSIWSLCLDLPSFVVALYNTNIRQPAPNVNLFVPKSF